MKTFHFKDGIRDFGKVIFGIACFAVGTAINFTSLKEFGKNVFKTLLQGIGTELTADALKNLELEKIEKEKFKKNLIEYLITTDIITRNEINQLFQKEKDDQILSNLYKKINDLSDEQIEKLGITNPNFKNDLASFMFSFINLKDVVDIIYKDFPSDKRPDNATQQLVFKYLEAQRHILLQQELYRNGRDSSVLYGVLMIKQLFEIFGRKIDNMQRLLVQYPNGITFERIITEKFTVRFLENACPGCGYNGDKIFIDKDSNLVVYCASCDSSYTISEYVHGSEEIENLRNSIDDLNEFCKKEIKSLNDEIKNSSDENKKELEQVKEKLENFQKILKDSDTKELSENILEGVQGLVTKEYFDAQLQNKEESIENHFKLTEKKVIEYINSISDDVNKVTSKTDKKIDSVLEIVKKKNKEISELNKFLSNRLDELKNQITDVLHYVKKIDANLTGISGKQDLILDYIYKLFTKEYLDEFTNAIGTSLAKNLVAIDYSKLPTISAGSLSKIIDSLNDLNKKVINAQGNTSKIEKIIKDENIKLSGQILGLTEILQSISNRNEKYFKQILRKLDEIKQYNFGIAVTNNSGFKNIYEAKLPSKFLYNDGYKEPSPCPFCGAEDIWIENQNDDQICKCKICHNKFRNVDPDAIELFYGNIVSPKKEWNEIFEEQYWIDKDLATNEKIEGWRKKHRYDISNSKWAKTLDGILIIDQENLDVYEDVIRLKHHYEIHCLIFDINVSDIHAFINNVNFPYLDTLIISPKCKDFSYSYISIGQESMLTTIYGKDMN